MARTCDVCGRGPDFGNAVSHSNRHTRRVRLPNLQRVRAVYQGKRGHYRVCTSCLRAGKIQKV